MADRIRVFGIFSTVGNALGRIAGPEALAAANVSLLRAHDREPESRYRLIAVDPVKGQPASQEVVTERRVGLTVAESNDISWSSSFRRQ